MTAPSLSPAMPMLAIDASRPRAHWGVIDEGRWLVSGSSAGGAVESLVADLATALRDWPGGVSSLGSVAVATRGGSLLGLRFTEMFARSLAAFTRGMPLYGYHAGAYAALAWWRANRSGCTVTAADRQGLFSRATVDAHGNLNCGTTKADEAIPGPVLFLEGRKTWSAVPPQWDLYPEYSLEALPHLVAHPGLLLPLDEISLNHLPAPEFTPWTPTPRSGK